MQYGKKYMEITKCWEDFRDRCNNKGVEKFMDIFYPMHMSMDNDGVLTNSRLEISVGKKQKDKFIPFLSSGSSRFNIKISKWEDEPQLIFIDLTNRVPMNMVLLNLNIMNDLHVEECTLNGIYCCDVMFNYHQGMDYHMKLKVYPQ